MRTIVAGDIHGARGALVQCLERAGFDRERDRLVTLGDLCDGWPETAGVIEELLTVRNLVPVLGNHDRWFLDYILTGVSAAEWLTQGGMETLASYGGKPVPASHASLLRRSARTLYHLEGDQLFVHGGIRPGIEPDRQEARVLLWDRSLLLESRKREEENCQRESAGEEKLPGLTGYRDVFVGHTPTLNFGSSIPLRFCEVRALDTGAAWKGPLTVMDSATGEYWQSDPVPVLYPGYAGRLDGI